MYKMYNTEWDDETDNDDKNSLNSSFWSDGEKPEEEQVEIERVIESKPVGEAEEDTSEEEKPELNNEGNFTTESLDEERKDDTEDEEEERKEEDGDEKSCSSSPDSPAPSLMTSGYGTYRAEEQEGGDYRDNHTITEFDQDSRGDLSEMRDDEDDDQSLGGFGEFDTEPTHEPDFRESPLCVLEDNSLVANVACCVEGGPLEEIGVTDMKPEDEEEQADEEKSEEDPHPASDNEMTNATEKPHAAETEDRLLLNEKHLEEGLNEAEKQEVVQDLHQLNSAETEVEDKVESEDPDESSSNKNIKFIDSKVGFSWRTCDRMCVEWEGNLRQKKDVASCLEEQLADLHLSTAAQRETEAESEDGSDQSDSQSSESDAISLSAFESYIRGMSDAAFRPKPKSFIRPVMSQQSIKKTDPVSKYFEYKQFWEMFKLPGERDRRALRWEIKEQLAYQPPPPKPRRVYLPNTYVVPTEKKRSALRWEIRNDLANGLLPHKFNYRF
ncbi:midasin isoform X1 [Acanthochromis polyacanthus]|uniref:midasin isoform X1 n=1 Tax=Acanthochromis polyacanthus TaxID=80966 RepID=UPI0022349824|nr:midasin isoform X1 [Acanthochromis polyacanthus]